MPAKENVADLAIAGWTGLDWSGGEYWDWLGRLAHGHPFVLPARSETAVARNVGGCFVQTLGLTGLGYLVSVVTATAAAEWRAFRKAALPGPGRSGFLDALVWIWIGAGMVLSCLPAYVGAYLYMLATGSGSGYLPAVVLVAAASGVGLEMGMLIYNIHLKELDSHHV